MPIEWVNEAEAVGRESKVMKTKEGKEILAAIGADGAGMKPGKVLKVTFSPETTHEFKDDEKKTAFAFALKLRKLYPDLIIKLVGRTQIHICTPAESDRVAHSKKQKVA